MKRNYASRLNSTAEGDPVGNAVVNRLEPKNERDSLDIGESTSASSGRTHYVDPKKVSVTPDVAAMFARILAADTKKRRKK